MATTAPVSAAIRDQFGDHLLTPKNSAMAVIDFQQSQLAGVRSMDRDLHLFGGLNGRVVDRQDESLVNSSKRTAV